MSPLPVLVLLHHTGKWVGQARERLSTCIVAIG